MPLVFQYEFMLRAIIGSALVGVLAPTLGTFIVLRRFSLIADTLSHVALMGAAIGLATRTYPSAVALLGTTIAAVVIEQLRSRGRLPGDVVLAVVLYGSLAVAVVVVSATGGFNVDLLGFLFGSVLSTSTTDLWLLAALATLVVLFVAVFFVELAQIAYDDDLARVNGVPVGWVNLGLAVLTGATITLSMRIVGVLLVGAMLIVPVLVGLRLANGLRAAIVMAVAAGVVSAAGGLVIAFYANLAAGGTIVLTAMTLLVLTQGWVWAKRNLNRRSDTAKGPLRH